MNIKKSIQEHQEQLDLNIHRYNRQIEKDNKKLQREIDEFKPERIVSRWAGDGNNKYQYTTCDIKLYEPLDVPVIVEVKEMSDHSSRLILESGNYIDMHIGEAVDNDTSKTDAILTKMQERQTQDYINSRNFNRDAEALVDQFGVCAEKLKSNVEQFFGQEGVKILCKVGANISERERLNQPDQGN